MFFNPLFLQAINSNESAASGNTQKSTGTQYLFSDIMKVCINKGGSKESASGLPFTEASIAGSSGISVSDSKLLTGVTAEDILQYFSQKNSQSVSSLSGFPGQTSVSAGIDTSLNLTLLSQNEIHSGNSGEGLFGYAEESGDCSSENANVPGLFKLSSGSALPLNIQMDIKSIKNLLKKLTANSGLQSALNISVATVQDNAAENSNALSGLLPQEKPGCLASLSGLAEIIPCESDKLNAGNIAASAQENTEVITSAKSSDEITVFSEEPAINKIIPAILQQDQVLTAQMLSQELPPANKDVPETKVLINGDNNLSTPVIAVPADKTQTKEVQSTTQNKQKNQVESGKKSGILLNELPQGFDSAVGSDPEYKIVKDEQIVASNSTDSNSTDSKGVVNMDSLSTPAFAEEPLIAKSSDKEQGNIKPGSLVSISNNKGDTVHIFVSEGDNENAGISGQDLFIPSGLGGYKTKFKTNGNVVDGNQNKTASGKTMENNPITDAGVEESFVPGKPVAKTDAGSISAGSTLNGKIIKENQPQPGWNKTTAKLEDAGKTMENNPITDEGVEELFAPEKTKESAIDSQMSVNSQLPESGLTKENSKIQNSANKTVVPDGIKNSGIGTKIDNDLVHNAVKNNSTVDYPHNEKKIKSGDQDSGRAEIKADIQENASKTEPEASKNVNIAETPGSKPAIKAKGDLAGGNEEYSEPNDKAGIRKSFSETSGEQIHSDDEKVSRSEYAGKKENVIEISESSKKTVQAKESVKKGSALKEEAVENNTLKADDSIDSKKDIKPGSTRVQDENKKSFEGLKTISEKIKEFHENTMKFRIPEERTDTDNTAAPVQKQSEQSPGLRQEKEPGISGKVDAKIESSGGNAPKENMDSHSSFEQGSESKKRSFENNATQGISEIGRNNEFQVKEKFAASLSSTIEKTVKAIEVIKEITKFASQTERGLMVLRIDPENLGTVRVALETVDNMLRANIEVENESARKLVESSLNQLQTSLNQNGVQLSSLDVTLAGYDQKSHEQQKNAHKRRPQMFNDSMTEEENSTNSEKQMGYNTYEYLA